MFLKENIAYIVENRRLKQKDLAEILNVSVAVAGTYINGRSFPKYDSLLLLSDYFGVTCDDLLRVDLSKGETQKNTKITQNNNNGGHNIAGNHIAIADEQINKLLAIIEEKDKQINKLIDKLN